MHSVVLILAFIFLALIYSRNQVYLIVYISVGGSPYKN